MMKFANAEWFFLLTQTTIGRLLIIHMMVIALATAFYVMKATKPENR
jgi:tight adherence protein B